MPAEAPWAGERGELAVLLGRALSEHGARSAHVRVRALGARDELAVDDVPEPVSRDVLNVMVYGKQAILGPFNAADAAADSTDTAGGAAPRPCARCLARRWQTVRSAPLRDALELGSQTVASGRLPFVTAFAADAIAALVAASRDQQRRRARSRASARVADSAAEPAAVYVLDFETLRPKRWQLASDSECPVCGRRVEDSAQAAELVLEPTPKNAPDSFRVRAAEDFGVRTEAYVNPVCGMLGPWVTPDLTSRTTAATMGSFTQRSGTYLRESFWGGHTDSYQASERVGVLEGFERFAGMRPRGKRTTVFAALAELKEPAVDPREVGLYSQEFHRRNPLIKEFQPDSPIPWVWGYSLRDKRPVLVPEILTYYHAPGGAQNRFVQESSNGCASGGSLAEAAYHGLMEVVERDAFLIAWYGRTPLPEIDPASSSVVHTRALVDRLEMYGYQARFFDARLTFPIPVVVAAAVRRDGGTGALCFGAGASLDPQAALAGGLCEIATDAVNLPWRTELGRERLSAMARDFDRVEVLHDHPLVYGLPEMTRHAAFLLEGPPAAAAPRSLAEVRAEVAAAGLAPSADLREDLERCVAAVAAAGFDVIVVDQTVPEQRDLGAVTVSVLVPGLVPIDFGWSRQRALHLPRLRTAPRQAGRRDRDLEAADLNPAPHPFP